VNTINSLKHIPILFSTLEDNIKISLSLTKFDHTFSNTPISLWCFDKCKLRSNFTILMMFHFIDVCHIIKISIKAHFSKKQMHNNYSYKIEQPLILILDMNNPLVRYKISIYCFLHNAGTK
jgi:hypothetical protein